MIFFFLVVALKAQGLLYNINVYGEHFYSCNLVDSGEYVFFNNELHEFSKKQPFWSQYSEGMTTSGARTAEVIARISDGENGLDVFYGDSMLKQTPTYSTSVPITTLADDGTCVVVSDDGNTIAAFGLQNISGEKGKAGLYLFSPKSSRVMKTFVTDLIDAPLPNSLSLSSDGSFGSFVYDKIYWLNLESSTVQSVSIPYDEQQVVTSQMSHNGEFLFIGQGNNLTLFQWDGSQSSAQKVFEVQVSDVYSGYFGAGIVTDDGEIAIIGEGDAGVSLYVYTNQGSLKGIMGVDQSVTVNGPLGMRLFQNRYLAATNKQIIVWDIENMKVLQSASGQDQDTVAVDLFVDSQNIKVVTCGNENVYVYEFQL